MNEPSDKPKSPQRSDFTSSLTAAQCRMARAAVNLGVRELAEAARVSTNTITRLERGDALYPRTIAAVRSSLEDAGVEFIAENGGGPGVRLRPKSEMRFLEIYRLFIGIIIDNENILGGTEQTVSSDRHRQTQTFEIHRRSRSSDSLRGDYIDDDHIEIITCPGAKTTYKMADLERSAIMRIVLKWIDDIKQ